MLEIFTKHPVFQGNDEIHQLDVIYRIVGTPVVEQWPGMTSLPWYELVKPKDFVPNHFRQMFAKYAFVALSTRISTECLPQMAFSRRTGPGGAPAHV